MRNTKVNNKQMSKHELHEPVYRDKPKMEKGRTSQI